MRWEHFTHGKQNICLPISYCLQAERATRQRRPLLHLKTKRLMVPARRWRRSLQLGISRGIAHGSSLPTANKYLFADLLFFTRGEGDDATLPNFTTRYVAIEASSASLEALIAVLLPADGTSKQAIFPTAINLLIAVELLFPCADGERARPPSCASICTYNTLL